MWSVENIGLLAKECISLVVNILDDLRSCTTVFNPKGITDLVNAAVYVALIISTTRWDWHPSRLLLNDLNVSSRCHNKVFGTLALVKRDPPCRTYRSIFWRMQSRKLLELQLVEWVWHGSYISRVNIHTLIDIGFDCRSTSFYTLSHDVTDLLAIGTWCLSLVLYQLHRTCCDGA